MKIIFLTFTPYHIKVSNFLASKKYDMYNKKIIVTDIGHTSIDNLKEFIKKSEYDSINYYNFNYKLKNMVKSYKKDKYKLDLEIEAILKEIKEFNPDIIVTFSDRIVIYQRIFNELKGKIKLILVEEGVSIYENPKNIDLKYKLRLFLLKKIYNCKEAKVFSHGKGGYADTLLAREPEMVETNITEKIKLSKEEFRGIFEDDNNKWSCIEKGILFAPAATLYDYKKMLEIYEEIFKTYNEKKQLIYVRLHPAEKYTQEIKKIINKYNKYIKLIEDKGITSESIILNKNITGIISDLSSTLINGYYLRDDLNLITYLGLMQNEYKLYNNLSCSILRKLIYDKKIKSFKDYDINVTL